MLAVCVLQVKYCVHLARSLFMVKTEQTSAPCLSMEAICPPAGSLSPHTLQSSRPLHVHISFIKMFYWNIVMVVVENPELLLRF